MLRGAVVLFSFMIFALVSVPALAWTPVPVKDDPLVRMPGTQPTPENSPDVEGPGRCLNCHGGFDANSEPAFNWQGSMMAQSARDPLFYACLTVAAQDVIWAVGNPNGTDICERCHFPQGWLEGRSDPTNASAFTGSDFDGVHCDVCHSMFDPFFEETYTGVREGSDWLGYWDETNASATPSQPAADDTYADDLRLSAGIKLFAGGAFYGADNLPLYPDYVENASGQMFIDDSRAKRASFADANARHNMFYSRYHKSKYFCSTCHDVSNPILANLGLSGLTDQSGDLITEQYSAFQYFHVERTFSEFMLSDYGLQGGAATNPEFQAQGAPDITHAAKCQDCHMRDVTGKAASQNSAVLRPDDSVEHPDSGQPLHDLTGGNAWVSYILASTQSGAANFDAVNQDLLVNQIYGPLTLDVNQGQGIDAERLLAGVDRAKQQLALAATIKNAAYDSASGALSFQVQNNSGHKLISGFPEGRRMFVNVRAYAGGNLVYEVNPYDPAAGTLKGLVYPYQPDPLGVVPDPSPLAGSETYDDALVYEAKPSSTLTLEDKTFHFALADDRYKDNRIPPKGFRITEAADRISQPRDHGTDAPGLYTNDEYAGGYDDVSLNIASGADAVEVNLYYQTTSREYMEFLRDEINGTGNLTLTGTGAGGDPPYLVQTDPFFANLRGWGDTIWHLWTHNLNVPGAAPILMSQATVGAAPPTCGAPVPTMLTAEPASNQVTVTWSDEHTADAGVLGYTLYYDQAGKAQLVADLGLTTTFTDTNLTNGNEYCYKVTAHYADCESSYSNILCATPQAAGQDTLVDVLGVETGLYVTTGKGKDKVITFELRTSFTAGDEVIVRAYVVDDAGLPVPNASVDIAISGPETVSLTTGPTDATGMAEAVWATSAPNKRGQGGTTPGAYTATAASVSGGGLVYSSELVPGDASALFDLN